MASAANFEKLGVCYLGRPYDWQQKKAQDGLILYDSKDLVTHAVCVGMTGSGKTGLCLALIEEAAIDGIPAILIDPKGDLANLLLTFGGLPPVDQRGRRAAHGYVAAGENQEFFVATGRFQADRSRARLRSGRRNAGCPHEGHRRRRSQPNPLPPPRRRRAAISQNDPPGFSCWDHGHFMLSRSCAQE
jgi:Helicase HerA, central domain